MHCQVGLRYMYALSGMHAQVGKRVPRVHVDNLNCELGDIFSKHAWMKQKYENNFDHLCHGFSIVGRVGGGGGVQPPWPPMTCVLWYDVSQLGCFPLRPHCSVLIFVPSGFENVKHEHRMIYGLHLLL